MKEQISNGMFTALLINMIYPKSIGLTQGIIARAVNGDMWLATFLGLIQGSIIMALVIVLIRRMPQLHIMSHSELILGKTASKCISITICFFFICAFITVMITYVYHLMDYFLPEAPVWIFVMTILVVCIVAVFHGIEVLCRLGLIGMFCIMVFNIILMVGSLSDFDIRELLPIFQSGFRNTLASSIHFDADMAVIIMMAALFLPLINNNKLWGKSSFWGIAYGGIFVLMWPILEAGVLSPEVTSQYIVACMQMARSAEIGLFIHRYEMIMVALFAIPLFLQLAICLYCAAQAASATFGVKHAKKTIIPISIIAGLLSYWVVSDHNRAMHLLTNYWPTIAITIAVSIPSLLFVAGYFRKNKIREENNKIKIH